MIFQTIPDDQVPEKKYFRGKARNPVNYELSNHLVNHPGEWVVCPLKEQYPKVWNGDVDGFRKAVARLRSSISFGKAKRMGAFYRTDGEFETRVDNTRMLCTIRFVRTEEPA